MDTVNEINVIFNMLNDKNKEKTKDFAKFLLCMQDNLIEIPNIETIEAINEVNLLKQNPEKKKYSSFSELLEEVKADV